MRRTISIDSPGRSCAAKRGAVPAYSLSYPPPPGEGKKAIRISKRNTHMKVGVIGVGDMGLPITGHLIGKQHTVSVYDVNGERAKAGGERGAAVAGSLAE